MNDPLRLSAVKGVLQTEREAAAAFDEIEPDRMETFAKGIEVRRKARGGETDGIPITNKQKK